MKSKSAPKINLVELISAHLQTIFTAKPPFGMALIDSINYSLLSSGKKLRGQLFLEVIVAAGGNPIEFIDYASSLELLHCYSLIHDDLPALDNDDFRRGQASNHKKFDEATAILAGDALLTKAFELAARKMPISAELQLEMISYFAKMAGAEHLILGQQADIELAREENTAINDKLLQRFEFIAQNKTAALFCLSINSGALAAKINAETKFLLNSIALDLGVHFQLLDDTLEFIENNPDTDFKSNYCSYFGLEQGKKELRQLDRKILDNVAQLPSAFNEFKLLLTKITNGKV